MVFLVSTVKDRERCFFFFFWLYMKQWSQGCQACQWWQQSVIVGRTLSLVRSLNCRCNLHHTKEGLTSGRTITTLLLNTVTISLPKENIASAEELDAIKSQVKGRVDAAYEFAQK